MAIRPVGRTANPSVWLERHDVRAEKSAVSITETLLLK